MTTGFDDSLSTADLILEAFSRIQIRPPAILQEHMAEARTSLILLNSSWTSVNKGLNLFDVKLGSLPLVQGTTDYTLASDVVFILDTYRRVTTNNIPTDTYMYQLSRTDYSAIPNKTQQGPPTQIWFERSITPTVHFYLTPDGGGPYTFRYYYGSQPGNVAVPMGGTPAVPFRFLDAMAADLAVRLARKFKPEMVDSLKMEKKEAWEEAASADRENTPMMIIPSLGAYFRRAR